MLARSTFAGAVMALALLATPGLTQTTGDAAQVSTQPGDIPPEAFASENAILDTSVLFAIGAREAEQELRGAFGWPTFQEGLVEGVYFRFDPDGYARFAPTPRLDADVFEVICRPRTTACAGRKQQLSIFLNGQGQLQIKLDDAVAGDGFFVSDGISELPVPERILMPLDSRFESLLSAGGELIVRRGDNEVLRVSLAGFSAVANYLRWVAARQDYTVLARGWPVPNGTGSGGASVTQSATWQSPMPQPQSLPILAAPEGQATEVAVAEVRGELTALRELMLARDAAPALASPTDLPAQGTDAETARLADLERAARDIQTQIAALRGTGGSLDPAQSMLVGPAALPSVAGPVPASPTAGVGLPAWPGPAAAAAPPDVTDTQTPVAAPGETETDRTARRLAFLISEIGLSPEAAVMLIGLQPDGPATPAETMPAATADPIGDAYGDRLLTDMLQMLAESALEGQGSGIAAAQTGGMSAATAGFPLSGASGAQVGAPVPPGASPGSAADAGQGLPPDASGLVPGVAQMPPSGPAAVSSGAAMTGPSLPAPLPMAEASGVQVATLPPAQAAPMAAGQLAGTSPGQARAANAPAAGPSGAGPQAAPVAVALPTEEYMLLSDYFRAALAAEAAAQAGLAPAALPVSAAPSATPLLVPQPGPDPSPAPAAAGTQPAAVIPLVQPAPLPLSSIQPTSPPGQVHAMPASPAYGAPSLSLTLVPALQPTASGSGVQP